MRGAETIVVGGGILGATTLWELAREGMEPLLLEAGRFGEASTGKSAAIVRCHYSNPEVVRMAVRSRELLRQLPLHLDCEPVYTRTGWLFLVDAESAIAAARELDDAGRGRASTASRSTTWTSSCPGASGAGIAYALFEPDSGFADPVATTVAYVGAARRAGARAVEGTAGRGDRGRGRRGARRARRRRARRVRHRRTRGRPVVGRLARGIGLELPLEITREQDVVFATAPEPASPVRGLVAGRSGLHAPGARVRRRSRARRPRVPEGLRDGRARRLRRRRSTTRSSRTSAAASLTRLPRLAGMRAVAGRVGLYDVTPDWHPLLGPVDGYDGLHLATGGSGHCFKLGAGDRRARRGRDPRQAGELRDRRDFSLSRFAEGRELASSYGGNRA